MSWSHFLGHTRSLALACAALSLLPAAAQRVMWSSNVAAYELTGTHVGDHAIAEAARQAMALDGNGNAFVAAHGWGWAPNCRVLKYSAGAGSVLWSRDIVSTPDHDCIVVTTPAGDAIVAYLQGGEFGVTKYAGASGNILWQGRTAGGLSHGSHVRTMTLDANGDVVVAGSRGAVTYLHHHARIAKFSGASGAPLWDWIDPTTYQYSDGYIVGADPQGNVVLVRQNWEGSDGNPPRIVKYSPAGAVLWEREFANRLYPIHALAIDGAGNIHVAAVATARKYSPDGTLLWERTLNAGSLQPDATSIALDAAGALFVMATADGGSTLYPLHVAKYAADGTLAWEQTHIAQPGSFTGFFGKVDAAGDLLVGGSTLGTAAQQDITAVKVNGTTGALTWQRRFNGLGNGADSTYQLAVDGAGAVLIVGDGAMSATHGGMITVKYDAGGTLQWQTALQEILVPVATYLRKIVADPFGNLILGGYSDGRYDENYVTAKVSAVDGAVLWTQVYEGPRPDASRDHAVDSAGNVLVTGHSGGWEELSDIRTFKYAASDGHVMWERTFNGPGNNEDIGNAIAVDAAGNAIVGGVSRTPGFEYQSKLFKYASANGATLWEANGLLGGINAVAVTPSQDILAVEETALSKYAGTNGAVMWRNAMTADWFRQMAMDASGNPIVLNTPDSGASGIAKYSGANGALAWQKTFTGSPFGSSWEIALRVDAAGNVIVAGIGNVSPALFKVMKFSGIDGTLLWERDLAEPGTNLSFQALAVDPAGNVTVTGYAGSYPTPYRLLAFKLSSNGAVRWRFNYASPVPNGGASGTALLATAEAVYVGGNSRETATGNSMRVVKIDNHDALAHDFNADAKPDIVWSNTSNGATYLWYMNGTGLALDAFITQIDPSWKIQGIADFNGDGHPDLVWRNTATGSTYVWYMNNSAFMSDALLFNLPPEWVIQGVADFNGDGKPDFLMRNVNSGNAFAWFFNDAAESGSQFLFNIDPSWKVEGVGDMNNDGQPDLLFRNMGSGLAFAWFTQNSGGTLSLAGSTPPLFGIDPVWEIVQVVDWNGDGSPDFLFRNRDTGLVFVWYVNGTTLAGSDFVTQIDPSWEIVPRR